MLDWLLVSNFFSMHKNKNKVTPQPIVYYLFINGFVCLYNVKVDSSDEPLLWKPI